jgi:hypothetical protein
MIRRGRSALRQGVKFGLAESRLLVGSNPAAQTGGRSRLGRLPPNRSQTNEIHGSSQCNNHGYKL